MGKIKKTNFLYFILPILLSIAIIASILYFLPAHDQIINIKQLPIDTPVPPQLYSSSYQLIGTGNRLGTYYPLGKIFADYFNQNLPNSNYSFKVVETNGSVDNVNLIEDGSLLLGMAESRIASEVYKKNKEASKIRVVWPLWLDVVHVLKTPETYEDVNIFPGKFRGFMGQKDSSTLRTSQEILEALENPRTNYLINNNEVIPSLATGKIGFAVIQAGMPNSTVADAILFNKCSIYSFSKEEIDKIVKNVSTSKHIAIPEKTYGSNQKEINTIAIPNILIANEDAPAELIESMVSLLIKNSSRLKLRYSTLESLPTTTSEVKKIFEELEIPLHEGVINYLNSKGAKENKEEEIE